MEKLEKKTFETKMRANSDGTIEKAIFIGGELLDWSIDVASLMEARKMGPKFFKAVQQDIEKHYLESVSEMVGRHVTLEELKEAIKTGLI